MNEIFQIFACDFDSLTFAQISQAFSQYGLNPEILMEYSKIWSEWCNEQYFLRSLL